MTMEWLVFLGLALAAVTVTWFNAWWELYRRRQPAVRVMLLLKNGEEVLEGVIRVLLHWQAMGWPLELAVLDCGSVDRSALVWHHLLGRWQPEGLPGAGSGQGGGWEADGTAKPVVFPLKLAQGCDARQLLPQVRQRCQSVGRIPSG